jgi:hypothetical protein
MAITATMSTAWAPVVAARNSAHAAVRPSTNITLARRRLSASRRLTAWRAGVPAWLLVRGVASYMRTGSGRRRTTGWLIRAALPPCVRPVARVPGLPEAAGRLSGDWASGRAIDRIATPRAGIARCKLESWSRKSDTDELGRFSIRERSSGGTSTAAHAAATTSRTT